MRHALEGHYGVSLAVAVLALSPYVVVTTAYLLYQQQITLDLHTSRTALQIVSGMATAGYAFGALLGGDLTNRLRQRSLFITTEALFVVGSLLAASAGGLIRYGAGRTLQGFATGLLLVIALPPVVRRFPAERLPVTAAWVNIGFFGAVALGPLLGGAVAAGHAWRWFYGGLGGVGLIVLVLSLFTLPDQEPPNPGLRFDAAAILLGLGSMVLPFWAVGELGRERFDSLLFLVPLAVGFALLVALLLTQYHREEPLAPVKLMWSTYAIVGTLVAMLAGGTYVTFIVLRAQWLLQVEHRPALMVGLLFWPQIPGVIVTASLLGALLRTRYLFVLILAGMLALVAGGLLLEAPTARAAGSVVSLTAVGLLGLGAGATVSPGLFIAGFALRSEILGRVLALVELVRSGTDFLIAPVMLEVARVGSPGARLAEYGVRHALWLTVLITIASIVLCAIVYLAGSAALPRPQIDDWLRRGQVAICSPALGARLRARPASGAQ